MTHAIDGHQLELLRNGGEYFPALLERIRSASRSIWIETYIFADDDTGRAVASALIDAASRSVEVRLVLDGFGVFDHVGTLDERMKRGGVQISVFRPETSRWQFRKSRLRRMHRKLVLIDDQVAFCGGINILDDFNMHGYANADSFAARFDFAVRIEGPITREIRDTMDTLWETLRDDPNASRNAGLRALERAGRSLRAFTRRASAASNSERPTSANPAARVSFLFRDNLRHRRSIEAAYLLAISRATQEVFIANAYFFPGKRLLAALNAAEARGVRVRLLLQGRKEYFLQHYASRAFYDRLFNSGIEIAEYTASFLHAKVAVIDGVWSTVGSSNIDPFSLLLAREANVFVEDSAFSRELRAHLDHAWANESRVLECSHWEKRSLLMRFKSRLAYRVARLLLAVFGYNLR
ncbi:MAG: cardiolipin synthase ClsB [Burkholderiales bacterium]|nr:MAG: cardiolipin synthase ClsB [Betaproteobacteria bacterium]TAG82939.1 MAG: cardiolipin synthase ClsB [Burkholderiales bacterium]